MKEKKPQKQLLQHVMLVLLSVVSVLVMANVSFAAMDCASCHGDGVDPVTHLRRVGTDMRPLDTPAGSPVSYRNITTGAVAGNHSEHMAATMNPAMCNRCHNNAGYTTSHRSGTISLLKGMNFSTKGTYTSPNLTDAGTYVFKNQTTVPTLGTCATVNCHFETVTPTWGANPASTTCDTCHSSVPTSASHAKHTAQYGGTASCTKCHAARPNFQHATSAGNVGRNIDLSQMTGTYTGSNFRYLPSDTGRLFGQCSTNYCHSSGQSFNGASATPTYKAGPVWNVNGSINCGSCHESNLLNTGTHSKHIFADGNCGNCHTGATSATMVSATHVDGNIDVNGTFAVGYTQGLSSPRGNNYGSCNTAACHSATTAAAPVTPAWGTVATCASCHAASPVSGAHTLHIAMPAVTCATCHTNSGATGHINNLIDVAQYSASVPKHAPGVYAATCTTACHSTDTAAVATPTWGAQSTCASCHALSPVTGAHTSHMAAPINAVCGSCHSGATLGTSGGGNHGNGNIDVVWYSPTSIPKHAPGVFAATCSTQCHNTYGTTAVTTPSWGLVSTCATCHAAAPVTGDHTKHFAATGLSGNLCGTCHTGATAGVTGGNSHGDSNIDVAQGYTNNNATKHPAGTYTGTCTTTCHNAYSAGTGIATPVWGTAATCDSCHAGTPVTGDHTKHFAATGLGGNLCASCHTGATAGVTGGAANHGDGNIDVAGTLAGSYSANVAKHASGSGYSTCTTTCHNAYSTSVAIATPVWGTAATCDSCHAGTPVTGDHTKHFTATALGGNNCASCHAGATAGVTGGAANHGDGNIDVTGTLVTGYAANVARHASGSGYSTCTTACHSAYNTQIATPVWGTAATCDSCHAATPLTGSHTKHVLHANVGCASCHTGATAGVTGGAGTHGDGNIDVAGTSAFTSPTNIVKHANGSGYSTCSNISCHNGPAANPFTAPAATWGATLDCAGCHAYPPATTDHATVNPLTTGVCNSCHSNTLITATKTTPVSSAFSNVQLHMNNVVEGGKCDSCHGYPPVQSMAGLGINANYSSAKLQNYSGGGGVHNVAGHLALTTKASQGNGFTPCLTCHPQGVTHNQGSGAFLTANVQIVVDTQFKFDKNRPIVYNAKQSGTGKTSGTCTNVACHFQKSPLWSNQTYTQGH